jgi:hypothetical protein
VSTLAAASGRRTDDALISAGSRTLAAASGRRTDDALISAGS